MRNKLHYRETLIADYRLKNVGGGGEEGEGDGNDGSGGGGK